MIAPREAEFTRRVLRYFGLPAAELREANVKDIAVQMGAGAPVILLGRRYRRSGWRLKQKKLVHELLHARGLAHDARSRGLEYYSDPRRDRLSARVRDDLLAGERLFRPARFGIAR